MIKVKSENHRQVGVIICELSGTNPSALRWRGGGGTANKGRREIQPSA